MAEFIICGRKREKKVFVFPSDFDCTIKKTDWISIVCDKKRKMCKIYGFFIWESNPGLPRSEVDLRTPVTGGYTDHYTNEELMPTLNLFRYINLIMHYDIWRFQSHRFKQKLIESHRSNKN
jgi:hypothetical protein